MTLGLFFEQHTGAEMNQKLENIRHHAWDMLQNVYEESKTGDESSRKLLLEHWDDLSSLFLMADQDVSQDTAKDAEVLQTIRQELVDALKADFPERSEIPAMKELGLGEVTVGEFLSNRDKNFRPEGWDKAGHDGWEKYAEGSYVKRKKQ